MDTHALCQSMVEWAMEKVPALASGYNYSPAAKEQPAPDVTCELNRTFVQLAGEELFPFWQLQQRMVEGFELEFSFMVENLDPEAAAEALRGYRDLLREAVMESASLGGRVPFRSPFVSFDFTPPFVEYEDGTTGREMTMTLTVGDLVEVDDSG